MSFYEIFTKQLEKHKPLKHSDLFRFSFICLALVFICKEY